MSFLQNLKFSSEPVAWSMFLAAVCMVLVRFGVDLSEEQIAALDALLLAGFGILARQNVISPTTAAKAGVSLKDVKEVAESPNTILVEQSVPNKGVPK